MSATPERQSRKVPPPHELAPHDYEILAEFRYLLMRFAAFSEQAAHTAGLAPRQHQALLAIKGYPGGGAATIGELAERLGIRHHSTVGLVDRLVSRGYLRRRADPRDRRRTYLSLTASGERALAGLAAAHQRELRRVAPLLNWLLGRLGPGGASGKGLIGGAPRRLMMWKSEGRRRQAQSSSRCRFAT